MVKVKICGITNLDDALIAAEAGADALGFVFYPKSPRYVTPHDAGEIIKKLPPFIAKVGVFVDAPEADVRETVRESGINLLQFHGSEPQSYCGSFGMPYVKAFRVKGLPSLGAMKGYPDASAFLLDTYSEKEMGGTGTAFDWDVAAAATGSQSTGGRSTGCRIILAGGLTPDNVAEAVKRVRPYAVDVSSGVESNKGIKDPDAVRKFILNAKVS